MELSAEILDYPDRCLICGHLACPICGDWCDVVDGNGKPCCNTQCLYVAEGAD